MPWAAVIWLKLLHISTVIVWCGALLYLLFLVAGRDDPVRRDGRWLPRTLFTLAATPAALVAIASGSALFVLQGPLALWLVAKLGLVTLLVLLHGGAGMLLLRGERRLEAARSGGGPGDGVGAQRVGSVALWGALLLLGGIATLVLQQPAW